MCVYTHTLEKDGNRLEEISGLAEKSLWNIGLYENCMWNYVNYVCWVLASWLSWSLLSFSPNCSFSWNCSLVKACKIFFFSLLTDFFKKEALQKKNAKNYFLISSEIIYCEINLVMIGEASEIEKQTHSLMVMVHP